MDRRTVIFWSFLSVASLGGALAGFSTSLLVAKKISKQPTADFGYGVDLIANGAVEAVVRQIDRAQDEVLVCDRNLRNLTATPLMKALQDAARRGVTVKILIDRTIAEDPRFGGYDSLRKGAVGQIYLSARPLFAQFIIVDQRVQITSSAPLTSGSSKDADSPIILLRHGGAAQSLRELFGQLSAKASEVK